MSSLMVVAVSLLAALNGDLRSSLMAITETGASRSPKPVDGDRGSDGDGDRGLLTFHPVNR
jgi:hypothetical protein